MNVLLLVMVMVGCGSDLAPLPAPGVELNPEPGPFAPEEETGTPTVDPTVPVPDVPTEEVLPLTVRVVEAPGLTEVLAWHCWEEDELSPVICATLGSPEPTDLTTVLELAIDLPPGPVLREARFWARVWGTDVGGLCVPLSGEGCDPPSGVTSAELVAELTPTTAPGVYQMALWGPAYLAAGTPEVSSALDQVLTGGAPSLAMVVSVWAEVEAELSLLVAPEQATLVEFQP